jgi:hypothetical protein
MYPLKCLRLFLSSLEDGNKECHECLIYRTYLWTLTMQRARGDVPGQFIIGSLIFTTTNYGKADILQNKQFRSSNMAGWCSWLSRVLNT